MKKRDKLKRLYFLLFSLSLTLTLSAQTSITKENNGKRPGDMLMKQLVDVIDAGDAMSSGTSPIHIRLRHIK